MKNQILVILSLLLAPFLTLADSRAVLLVPEEYPSIQSAIDASFPGDTVLVSPGIYEGQYNRNLNFNGKNIILKSSGGSEVTIIDAGGEVANSRGIILNHGETQSAVIDGFTIQNASVPTNYGGGIALDRGNSYMTGASPTIKNVILRDNTAGIGGGIYMQDSSAQIINTVVELNHASSGGGVMIQDSRAAISPRFYQVRISDNQALDDGGGMIVSVHGSSVVNIISSTISYNQAQSENPDRWGTAGGIYKSGSGALKLLNVLLNGNQAERWGGAISSFGGLLQGNNLTFSENHSGTTNGGAVYAVSNDPSNMAVTVVRDSIIWNGGTNPVFTDPSAVTSINYSIVEGGYSGVGNLNQDPLFVNGPLGQFYVRSLGLVRSPAIDAGSKPASEVILWNPWGPSRNLGVLTVMETRAKDLGVVDLGYHYERTL